MISELFLTCDKISQPNQLKEARAYFTPQFRVPVHHFQEVRAGRKTTNHIPPTTKNEERMNVPLLAHLVLLHFMQLSLFMDIKNPYLVNGATHSGLVFPMLINNQYNPP